MRTIAIAVTVIALLVAAAICYRPSSTIIRVPGGPSLVVEEQGTDWSSWLTLAASLLTALEVFIRGAMAILNRRKATPTPDTPSDPMTPKPPDGST